LDTTGSCAVEFVNVFPADPKDNRRCIGGIICSEVASHSRNLHSHPVSLSLSHKLSSMVTTVTQKKLSIKTHIPLIANWHVVRELDTDLV